MAESRRTFIKSAGCGLLGALCAAPLYRAMAQAFTTEPNPMARVAGRFGMVVDTRRCAAQLGCTACSDACHRAHNVPTIPEPRHEVKWIWKERFEHAFASEVHAQTALDVLRREVLVLCNHCQNPPCVRVCPTQATWQRPDGVVMIDAHRCIGCRFCVVACPYGARSFNWLAPDSFITAQNPTYPRRAQGVVEKCNFCEERLAKGLGPWCVEACRNVGAVAMVFGDLTDTNSEISRLLAASFTLRRKPHLGTQPSVFYIV